MGVMSIRIDDNKRKVLKVIASIDKSIIVKKIGRLSEKDVNEFKKLLVDFFNN